MTTARAEAPGTAPPARPSAPAEDSKSDTSKVERETSSTGTPDIGRPPPEKVVTAPPSPVKLEAAPGKGITIASQDDRYSLNLRARISMRDTLLKSNGVITNEAGIRTARLMLGGNVLSPNIKYFVQLAFGGGDYDTPTVNLTGQPKVIEGGGSSGINSIQPQLRDLSLSPIYDAHVDFTFLRDANIRVGQFYVPFDRLRTIRDFALDLVDRENAVRELSLDRDTGVMLYSSDLFGLNERLGYNLGVFNGDGRNRVGGSPFGLLYVGRLTVRPFGGFDDDVEGDFSRAFRPRLALSAAAGYNQATTRTRSETGPTTLYGTFNYDHAEADVVFKFAGFSFIGEFLYRHGTYDSFKDVANGKPVLVNGVQSVEYSRSARGYVYLASYFLTDKLEVVGRFDRMVPIGKTDPALIKQLNQQGNELGGGLNYYLNQHQLKLQADYFHLYGVVPGADQHQVRLQVDATF